MVKSRWLVALAAAAGLAFASPAHAASVPAFSSLERFTVPANLGTVQFADLNGDPRPDFVAVEAGPQQYDRQDSLVVGRGRTAGGFDLLTISYGVALNDAVIGDINGDGRGDLVSAGVDGQMRWQLQAADGSFGSIQQTLASQGGYGAYSLQSRRPQRRRARRRAGQRPTGHRPHARNPARG